MKYYDNGTHGIERTHTIRVTLQFQDYIGHISYKMGGNCLGKTLLDWDPSCDAQEDIAKYVENDCKFAIDEETEIYTFDLKNDKGDTCEFECTDDELEDFVVAIEIIDCVINKRK